MMSDITFLYKLGFLHSPKGTSSHHFALNKPLTVTFRSRIYRPYEWTRNKKSQAAFLWSRGKMTLPRWPSLLLTWILWFIYGAFIAFIVRRGWHGLSDVMFDKILLIKRNDVGSAMLQHLHWLRAVLGPILK